MNKLRGLLIAGVIQYGSIRKLGKAIGVPSSTLHDWIQGTVEPNPMTQRGIKAALEMAGVSAAWQVDKVEE